MKENQSELKNTVTETKNTLGSMNSRLNDTELRIIQLEQLTERQMEKIKQHMRSMRQYKTYA